MRSNDVVTFSIISSFYWQKEVVNTILQKKLLDYSTIVKKSPGLQM